MYSSLEHISIVVLRQRPNVCRQAASWLGLAQIWRTEGASTPLEMMP